MSTSQHGRDPRCRTNSWGVDLAFKDALGAWHDVPEKTEAALLAAMGTDPHSQNEAPPDVVIVMHDDQSHAVSGRGSLMLESGEVVEVHGIIPPGQPHGYHRFYAEGMEHPVWVIVAPRQCFLPPDLKTWGWSVQLYAARSRESWGIGDFQDLHTLATWSVENGKAGMMLLNPLAAATPVKPIEGSPYFPSTRLFLSPLWLHVPSLPGAAALGPALEELDREARVLNATRLIDRDRVFQLKMQALEMLWKNFDSDAVFDRFSQASAGRDAAPPTKGGTSADVGANAGPPLGTVALRNFIEASAGRDAAPPTEGGTSADVGADAGPPLGTVALRSFIEERGEYLQRFATFCAIAERYQSGWHSWPEEYRHPQSPSVNAFAIKHADRVRFHQWVQWLLDTQLAQSAGVLDLMQDLPIGFDPDGADAWAWQDVIAQGVGVGAPPDEFNTQGQDWGLPPFVPHKLRAAGYQPIVETIRAAFRHCHALRIDHVMGLFRLFWVPGGMSAADGAYVRYNEREMLSIVALESERARAYVVGEDLGTVEDGARETLAGFNILSYRLLWFEKDHPSAYPKNALAAVTTHDLPTVAGLWTGSDLQRQRELGLKPNDESTAEIHSRLTALTGLNDGAALPEVIAGTYRVLSAAPSRILTACLDDALAVEERPNIPATTGDKTPNWSLALPSPIEDIMTLPLAAQIAQYLRSRAG